VAWPLCFVSRCPHCRRLACPIAGRYTYFLHVLLFNVNACLVFHEVFPLWPCYSLNMHSQRADFKIFLSCTHSSTGQGLPPYREPSTVYDIKHYSRDVRRNPSPLSDFSPDVAQVEVCVCACVSVCGFCTQVLLNCRAFCPRNCASCMFSSLHANDRAIIVWVQAASKKLLEAGAEVKQEAPKVGSPGSIVSKCSP
jgi:hypothetical protein